MDKQALIREALKAMHDKPHYNASALMYGICTNINGIDTIDVDVDGITYHDVQLQAIKEGSGKSLVIVPAKGSSVLIGNVEQCTGFVLMQADKAERILVKQADGMYIDVIKDVIKLNGDSEGGVLIEKKLVDELKKVNDILQAIMTILSGPPIPEPGSGAPSALQTALKGVLAGKLLPAYLQITNDKVKHGK
jgi:hypothetical protein